MGWINPSRALRLLHILWQILRNMSECLFAAVFLPTNSFASSAKFMLSRIFSWICTSIRACSQLFPVDLKYDFTHFKEEKMRSLSAFVTC